MTRHLCVYAATLVALLAIDAVWLALTAAPLYRTALGDLLLPSFRPLPALAFYLLYVAGILIFVGPRGRGARGTALFGALFGLVCYGTYDLTNQATLLVWPLTLTLADMAWGAALTAAASTLGRLAGERLARRFGR
jgi:uncharacterized membrane protein